MFEKIPFGQTPEQKKKAEEILSGSGLELEDDLEDKNGYEQIHRTKSVETKSIDDASKPSKEELEVAEDTLSNSKLKNATLEDEYN